MTQPLLIVGEALDSPARTRAPDRTPMRVAAVQHAWIPDGDELRSSLAAGVRAAADAGAELICLGELTLYPYFATSPDGPASTPIEPEAIPAGQTASFAADLARETKTHIIASLPERSADGGLWHNTAVLIAPDGSLVARTRKVHLPVTAGYYEDRYFRTADAAEAINVVPVDRASVGFPTCWDEWFPELARAYSLAGAELLVYPTAIGSEPDHPDFDTQPLWQQVIVANGIMNGTFMIVPNRVGSEGLLTFYGSSFISDPYGRILAQAPRDKPAVIVADLDLDQRRDWLELFPFLNTRRPDVYLSLTS